METGIAPAQNGQLILAHRNSSYYGLTQLQQGVPLSVVQHRMGHAWILTTLPYETLAKKLPPSS